LLRREFERVEKVFGVDLNYEKENFWDGNFCGEIFRDLIEEICLH
jgi:hypothetical protein